MLEMLERFMPRIRAARRDEDIVSLLRHVASALGFRSGYIVEYAAISPALNASLTAMRTAGPGGRSISTPCCGPATPGLRSGSIGKD